MSQLNKTRGEGSSADWKQKLRREIASVDFCLNAKKLGLTLSHVDTKVSQTPKGPNSRLRSRNSILLARRSKSWLFKISVTKRNILGAFLNLAKFRLNASKPRLSGIKEGWGVPIE